MIISPEILEQIKFISLVATGTFLSVALLIDIYLDFRRRKED